MTTNSKKDMSPKEKIQELKSKLDKKDLKPGSVLGITNEIKQWTKKMNKSKK